GRGEVGEEMGLGGAFPLVAVGDAWGLWDGREDKVHFFELRLDRLPELQLDNREIIAARLISPSELRGMALTGPVAVYLGRTIPPRVTAQRYSNVSQGIRSILVYCADYRCGHSLAISADHWSDDLRLSDIVPFS